MKALDNNCELVSKPVANLRLFAAVYPPSHLVEQWLNALNRLQLPPHRVVPLEQIHLTLQFIGDTPSKELDKVIESVERAASGLARFTLHAERLITLPERGPSRLIAVETNAHPTLLELQRRHALRLARNVRAKPGQKFRPHLTLCRFKSPTRVKSLEAQIATESFAVEKVVLMRSTLRPKGAEHIEVATYALE